ncbi:3-hydroxyacyl-CoA dehydrogenase family protein [Streptomyces sp. NPDC048436]|uniref:3-hydroxyacyl-CoA dehydrogenase family protein n=1 Tax=Streptomyces sp. NPDC048436 TaxID=3365550 RepID=UPI00371022B6
MAADSLFPDPSDPSDPSGRPVARAAVVGLGATGRELARRLVAAGISTTGVEPDPRAAAQARTEASSDLLTVTDDLSATAAAEVVFEAVPEPEPRKRAVLRALALYSGAPVVTTALTTPVAELADPEGAELLALRFVRADRLDTAELARGPHTSDGTAAHVTELLRRMGITSHAVPDRPGSLAPALLFGILNQAAWTYHEGYADREALETALRLGCGWDEGPLAILDAIGHRTARDILEGLHQRLGERYRPAPLVAEPVTRADPPRQAAEPGVRTVAVIGSGTMATGIAEVFLRAGYRTLLVARTPQKAEDAREAVEFGLQRSGTSADDLARALGRWTGTTDLARAAEADLVVEAVVEDLAVKRTLFAELGQVCGPGTLLATTTSSLSVHEIAEPTGRPENVVGLHFFNPPPAMRLVELVHGRHTGDTALQRARAVLNRLGKVPVECADRTGFLVNALLFPCLNDALGLLGEAGVEPPLLDAVMKSVGRQPLGPTRLLDTVGADVALEVQRRLHEATGRPELVPARLLEQLVAEGFLGRKSSGRGVRAYLTARSQADAA